MSIQNILLQLSEGMARSVAIFLLTLLFSLPLGLVVCFGRRSRFWPISLITRLFISIMRGTPLMLQLMVVYFGPYYLLGIKISTAYQFYAVIIAFSINYAAYFAEIYRAGIESIPRGQYEAARVLGYGGGLSFLRIILPQVVKRVLPPVTNEMITLVKDTSLSMVIAYAEMFTVAKRIAAKEANMVPFICAGIFYFIFNFIVAAVMERVEKKLNYYR